MVYILTSAYNAERTLHTAVNSVLNQTYTNFLYYLIDNGSFDHTKKIIQEYANENKKISPIYYQFNQRIVTPKIVEKIISETSFLTKSYFVTLDADDEYAPDFLEKMLLFMKENKLEVATCGSEWIDGKTGKTIKQKVIDRTVLLEGSNFAEQFPYYRNFMVTVWGAVYSLELLRRCNNEWTKNAMNFSDTAFCMEAFRKSKHAGVLAESLHKYYISPETVSYKYNPEWFQSCKYLHKISREYLLDYGEISKENEDYLWVLFLILLKYILPRIQQADVDLSEKLKSLHDIFTDEMTQYVLKHWEKVGIYSNKSDFLGDILAWIHEQNGWEVYRQLIDEIVASFRAHYFI